jgi:NAD(P)-dependent dehydrogenase (short-subunit alcohol dehydrogenase family)
MRGDRTVEVKDRTVLITGAARGMGKLWAERFSAHGAAVALWDVDRKALAATAAGLRSRTARVFTDTVDVTDAVEQAASRVEERFRPVDILVNNAGIVAGGPFLDVPAERHAAVLDVNVKGVLLVARAVLARMVRRRSGHILNISSAAGFIGTPYMAAYCASKWGVIGLTEALRLEMELLGHTGIRFALFCPSYVDTGMFTGVKPPLLVPLLSPEEAVRRGYEAFVRGTYMIQEPLLVKATPALRALLPTPVFDRVARRLGVTTAMREWKGHGTR